MAIASSQPRGVTVRQLGRIDALAGIAGYGLFGAAKEVQARTMQLSG